MKKIICNTKLEKLLIITLIIMLFINFIFPSTINFVYAAEFSREMFYPSDPNNWGFTCAPEELDEDLQNSTDWNWEDWDKDVDDYITINNSIISNPDLPDINENNEWDMDYDTTSIQLAVDAHNSSLKEAFDLNNDDSTPETAKIKLVDALNEAIDAAVASRK